MDSGGCSDRLVGFVGSLTSRLLCTCSQSSDLSNYIRCSLFLAGYRHDLLFHALEVRAKVAFYNQHVRILSGFCFARYSGDAAGSGYSEPATTDFISIDRQFKPKQFRFLWLYRSASRCPKPAPPRYLCIVRYCQLRTTPRGNTNWRFRIISLTTEAPGPPPANTPPTEKQGKNGK